MAKTTSGKNNSGKNGKSNSSKRSTSSSSSKKTATKKSTRSANGGGSDDLMKLFEHGLKDIYWVEKALTKAIPKMTRKTKNEELLNALQDHLKITEKQIQKVEKVFSGIGKEPRAKKCTGMDGILKEGEELMSEFKAPVLDNAIIAAAQKVEHYEMSAYMSLITLARTLDLVKEEQILQQILEEEREADNILNNIAIASSHTIAIEEEAV